MAEYHPYSSAVPFFQETAPGGLPTIDQQRIQAYNLYEQFYWSHPETFKLLQRGEDQSPIYLPASRKIIEATNRFLAVDFDYVVETGAGGTASDIQIVDDAFKNLFKRERFFTKFISQKRFGLIRGDAIWHITADDTKPLGSRISIHAVHPGQYFPWMDDSGRRLDGCHLVDTVPDPKDENKQLSRVQTYRRDPDSGGITSELALFEIGKWDDRNLKPVDISRVAVLVPPTPLPTAITSIPVYHIRNTEDESPFGSSLLRGIETVMAAVNQTVSDENLALVMAGLGGYWTDAGPPQDAAGNPTAWELGPLRMTEVPPGRQVGRLQGVGTVAPSQDHIELLMHEGGTGVGVPDIAAGKVDVAVAESGISLRLQMAPILASNAEREQAMIGVYDQMFFDIARMWMATYEQIQTEVSVGAIVGDPMPKNREAQIKEIADLVTAKLITIAEGRAMLIKEIGLDITPDASAVLEEQTALASASDPFGARVEKELAANDPTKTPNLNPEPANV